MDPAEPPIPPPRAGPLPGSPTARRILDLVRGRPGVTTREVASSLDLSWGTVTYHRRRLERDGLLRCDGEGRRRVLHAREPADDPHLPALDAMLRGGTMRRVALAVQTDPGLGEEELSRRLALPPRALAYHLDRLVAAGLATASGGPRREALTPTPLLDLLLGDPEARAAEDDALARR